MTSEEVVQKTLALIKPDSTKAGNTAFILDRINNEGFVILAQKKVKLTKPQAEEFYKEHEGKPFYGGLVEFMTSGDTIALCLARTDAIQAWRDVIGPTDTNVAKQTAPQSLRAVYGGNPPFNAVHGSDSVASAQREIGFFFPSLAMTELPDSTQAREYISTNIMPTLTTALTALCKAKPEAPIEWLAHKLLEINPNQPLVEEPDDA